MEKEAIFAGGCFWCMVQPFASIEGVKEVLCGYIGGETPNPTYEQVCTGTTGHYEAVKITYDPSKVSYKELLDVFWKQIDPTDPIGQFADKGTQYKTGIFFLDQEQKALAEKSKDALERSGKFPKGIATKILSATTFYVAEEYHQDYYLKNPLHYKRYRVGSGRQRYLDKVWGDKEDDKKNLRKSLTKLQHHVTKENGTEPPFSNAYWDNSEDGIYVDVISGEALFSSEDKYDSGTGWPSFTKPIEGAGILEKEDRSHNMVRLEARSESSDSHLGHVFDDGPDPDGKRYCLNSAALRFIPLEKLEEEGYGKYSALFKK